MLEILRDELGFQALSERVKKSLHPPGYLGEGLRVAPYYGCLLLRPFDEIGLDDPEKPGILHDLLRTLGVELVDFPYSIECCGSYLTVKEPRVSETLSKEIVDSAREHGAQAIVTACPWCERNFLDAVNAMGEKIKVYDIVELVQQAV